MGRWPTGFMAFALFARGMVMCAEPGARAAEPLRYSALKQAPTDAGDKDLQLGDSYFAQTNYPAAVESYRKALKARPGFVEGHIKLGRALQQLGRIDESLATYREAVELDPKSAEARWSLGGALALQGKPEEALKQFMEARRLDPKLANVTKGIILTTMQLGKADEALKEAERASVEWRDDAEVQAIFAQLLVARGDTQRGVERYRQALRLAPDALEILNNLAWLLATHRDAKVRDGKEAVKLAERACELTNRKAPMLLGTLAAAYAEAGRFDEAVKAGEEAANLAMTTGNNQLAEANRKLVEQYRAGKPHREGAGGNRQ